MGNLATRYESQPAVVEGRGILGLVKCLKDEDMHVRHFGALGLVNLTNRPTFHPPAVDVGAIEALAVVADRSDVLPKRYACLALGNLAITGLYNNHYVSSGAVPTLVAALDSENEVETRFNAAYAIGKLAHDPGMHEVRVRQLRLCVVSSCGIVGRVWRSFVCAVELFCLTVRFLG